MLSKAYFIDDILSRTRGKNVKINLLFPKHKHSLKKAKI